MAHEIDITDGKAAALFARQDAWHQLGTTLQDSFTAEQAMTEGLLGGWNVRKSPLYTRDEEGNQLEMPGRYAVLRTNPVRREQVDVIGDNLGEGYHIVQNEEHAGFLNALVDESGAIFETAGSLRGGRQVFITMKLPTTMKVGGVDPVDVYLAAINSHDGSMSFTAMATPVRIVCKNTMNLAFEGQSPVFRVRHSSGMKTGLVTRAREALDLTFKYLDGMQAEAEKLINATLTQQRFEEIIQSEFGAAPDAPPATVTRAENKIDSIAELFADGATQANIRNTAWAGLNALTEWSDHHAPVRGGASAESARAERALLTPAFKDRALALMLAQV